MIRFLEDGMKKTRGYLYKRKETGLIVTQESFLRNTKRASPARSRQDSDERLIEVSRSRGSMEDQNTKLRGSLSSGSPPDEFKSGDI